MSFIAPWLLCGALATAASPSDARMPDDVIYDYAVASYCGSLSPEAEAGFRQELAVVTDRFQMNEADARTSRLEGWLRADLEWSNRGLGGFRNWCATEGVAAATHFLEISRGQREP